MKKVLICILSLFLVMLFLSSCGLGHNGGPTMHVTDPTMPVTTVAPSEQTTEQITEMTTELTEPDISIATETQTAQEGQEVMLVSADPNNQYLNAVVQKYGVSADRLVAFYASSMSTEGNLVFEFDGTVDSGGRPVRTTNTLKNIYTVSSDLVAKKASGTPEEGNEYNEKDTKYCELFVKWVVFKIYAKDIQNA